MGGPKGGGELRWRRVAEAGAAGGGTKAIAGAGFVGAEGVLVHPFPCGLSPRAAFGDKLGYFTKRCHFNKWRFPVSILPAGERTRPGPSRASVPLQSHYWATDGRGVLFWCSPPSLSPLPGGLCPMQGSLPSVLPSCL